MIFLYLYLTIIYKYEKTQITTITFCFHGINVPVLICQRADRERKTKNIDNRMTLLQRNTGVKRSYIQNKYSEHTVRYESNRPYTFKTTA